MKNITLPIAIILGCIVIGAALVFVQLLKQGSIERQQQINVATQAARDAQAEATENNITYQRTQCLNDARYDYEKALAVSMNFKDTVCEEMRLRSDTEWNNCLIAVNQSASEDETELKSQEQSCYDRFPVQN